MPEYNLWLVFTEEPWFYYGTRKGTSESEYLVIADDQIEAARLIDELSWPNEEVVGVTEYYSKHILINHINYKGKATQRERSEFDRSNE